MAGAASDRPLQRPFDHHHRHHHHHHNHIHQPATSVITSNSVPSTPLQQAHDVRFHSRSPSPSRRLHNLSPRSIASDATGGNGPRRLEANMMRGGIGGVCRFESGAEIRKRRIPYVDGGNEELGPPKKEPRKTLEPDERDRLTGDMRELYDRLLPTDESEQRRARLVAKLDRILKDEYPEGDISVNVFGSSGNLLSSNDSDVDICITTSLQRLNMHALAELLHRNGMEKVVCRASAKVPIVKYWDPELDLAADLNVNNPLAMENTRMIRTYVQLDDRVRPLANIIKYWTKRRILNDAAFGGTISSYTWICMIISFLQRREPPILPSLQNIKGKRQPRDRDGLGIRGMGGPDGDDESPFADDLDALKGCGDANKESQAELLFQFFRHYGYEFDYSKYVVSVKEARLVTRKEKGWHPSNYADKEARNRLCVEEPFTVVRNLGNSADDYAWSGIHGEIRRAFDLLADGSSLEKCCEQFEFPPEEMKPIFQKPPPKPKPTLTRSASQSGRASQDGGPGRQRKSSGRNPSSQRPSNRRASSGATFSNQRIPLPFQSPMGAGVMDYFGSKSPSTLHDQLASQYQFLQAQAEVLQRRLSQQQQAARLQAQAGDLAGSPLHNSRAFAGSLPGSHVQLDGHQHQIPLTAPLTAPMLPLNYMWHYPARLPAQTPQRQQTVSNDGSSTNPSSPSLSVPTPTSMRQSHRPSLPSLVGGSMRSQSQPGRSLPQLVTLPSHGVPAYDMAASLGASYLPTRSAQGFPYTSPFPQASFGPHSAFPGTAPSLDTAMPKEYIGYYVGQSPQLTPQYASAMSIPPVSLQNPPLQRSRRVTPDLMPPISNGSHSSRSPSPLGYLRTSLASVDPRSATQHTPLWQSPPPIETPAESVASSSPVLAHVETDSGGPLIVNGSNDGTSHAPMLAERVNGIGRADDDGYGTSRLAQSQTLSVRNRGENIPPLEQIEQAETPPTRVSPVPRLKPGTRLNLTSPNGSSALEASSAADVFSPDPLATPIQAPLLSPVAEMRTPSPTHPSCAFAGAESPPMTATAANGTLAKAAMLGVARHQSFGSLDEPMQPTPVAATHENTSAADGAPRSHASALEPVPVLAPGPTSPAALSSAASAASAATGPVLDKNPWQQAPGRKGHRKSKSLLGGRPAGAGQGQPLPAHESERKGG